MSGEDPQRKREASELEGSLHDVSNALTLVLAWVREARDVRDEPASLDAALSVVETHARAARDLARRAIGACVAQSEPSRLGDVVASAVHAFSPEFDRLRVRCVLDVEAGGVLVTDPAALAQVLSNLLMNAVVHAPPDSVVSVKARASERDALVTLDVSDEGSGVPAAIATRLFEGVTTREGGAGVGLPHARRQARGVGGDLVLAESARGATFRVSWPAAACERAPTPLRSKPVLPVLAGARVLVLEDDDDVCELLDAALSARGAEVTVAKSAAELLVRLSGDHDTVLVDLSPIAADVSGALALLRSRAPRASVVFITGSADSLPDGAVGTWVRKPFDVAEIVTAVAAVDRTG